MATMGATTVSSEKRGRICARNRPHIVIPLFVRGTVLAVLFARIAQCQQAPNCEGKRNGLCDRENNNKDCKWDGGDCCENTCKAIGNNTCGQLGYNCLDARQRCTSPGHSTLMPGSSCVPCVAGTYDSLGDIPGVRETWSCVPCPSGRFGDVVGATSEEQGCSGRCDDLPGFWITRSRTGARDHDEACAPTCALGEYLPQDSVLEQIQIVENSQSFTIPVEGLKRPSKIAISPDARHVYVAGTASSAISFFEVYEQKHELSLSYIGAMKNREKLDGQVVDGVERPSSVLVSPDGRHLYVASGDDQAVTIFSRDQVSGNLGYLGIVTGGMLSNGLVIQGLDGATDIAISPDGLNLYVAAEEDRALTMFERDSRTGALTYLGRFVDHFDKSGQNRAPNEIVGLKSLRSVAVSPDGRHVYLAAHGDDGISTFARDPRTGMLAHVDLIQRSPAREGMKNPVQVAVSPDGVHIYLLSQGDDAVSIFLRNIQNGTLTYLSAVKDDAQNPLRSLRNAHSLTISPDGQHVIVVGRTHDQLGVFERDTSTGHLTHVEVVKSGVQSGIPTDPPFGSTGKDVSPLADPEFAAMSTTSYGDVVFVTGREGNAVLSFKFFPKRMQKRLDFFSFVRDADLQSETRETELNRASDVAVTRDGEVVFVSTARTVSIFRRAVSTGEVTPMAALVLNEYNLNGTGGIGVSPDGHLIYVAAYEDGAVTAFSRDERGEFQLVHVVRDNANVEGLDGVRRLLVSHDGHHVYTVSEKDFAVSSFSRNLTTGTLTFISVNRDTSLSSPNVGERVNQTSIAMSIDARHVYVASSTSNQAEVSMFLRNSTSGALTHLGVLHSFNLGAVTNPNDINIPGLAGARSVAVSPDDRHVYVAGGKDDAIVIFERNATTGLLSFIGVLEDASSVNGVVVARLERPQSVVVSPDGQRVIVGTISSKRVSVFARDVITGLLAPIVGGVNLGENVVAVAISPDGRHVYALLDAILPVDTAETVAIDADALVVLEFESCVPCNVGHTCSLGDTIQVPCGPGYFADRPGQSSCKACPEGSFQNASGQSGCNICEIGKFAPVASAICSNCPDGTFADRINLGSASDCQSCTPGRFAVHVAGRPATQCETCDAGKYSNVDLTACNDCPAGRFGTLTGLEKESDCLSCPPGSHATGTIGASREEDACTDCVPGKFRSHSDSVTFCNFCPDGTISAEYGQSACTSCPAGTYPSSDSAECLSCPAGTYSTGEQASCDSCIEGSSYTASNGSTSCTMCATCPEGTKESSVCSLVSDRTCEPCEAGSYQNSTNQATCTPCPAGYYCPEGSRDRLECGAPSLYCEEGSERPTEVGPGNYTTPEDGHLAGTRVSQEECPSGFRCVGGERAECEVGLTFAHSTGSSACDTCTTCFPGTRVSSECSLVSDRKCEPCEAGSYQNATNQATCTRCSAGYYCPEGSREPLECGAPSLYCEDGIFEPKVVASGYFSKPINGDPRQRTGQEICPVGSRCVGGERSECDVGSTFTASTGSSVCDTCTTCSPGTKVASECSLVADRACELCEAGTHQSSVNQDGCTECPTGFFADVSGSVSCTSCTMCSPGTRVESNCTETSDRTCLPCGAGTFQNGVNADTCEQCPAGFYCPEGSREPLECGAPSLYCEGGISEPAAVSSGYFSTPINVDPGQRSGQEICQAGFYCAGGVQINCSSISDQVRCPQGRDEPVILFPGTILGTSVLSAAINFTGVPPEANRLRAAIARELNIPEDYISFSARRRLQAIANLRIEGPAFEISALDSGVGSEIEFAVEGAAVVITIDNVQDNILRAGPGEYITGTKDQERIETCLAGHYCQGQSTPMLPCPEGTYSTNGSHACASCPRNTYQNVPGQTSCIVCPQNSVSSERSPTVDSCRCLFGNEVKTSNTAFFCGCPRGEFLDDLKLKSVIDSLDKPPDSGSFEEFRQVCQPCGPGYVCDTEGKTLISLEVPEGYWRAHKGSPEVLACFSKSPCRGGNSTGDALCRQGHSGPYCAVCEDDYYHDTQTNHCERCASGAISRPIVCAVAVVVLVVVLFACLFKEGDAAGEQEAIVEGRVDEEGDKERRMDPASDEEKDRETESEGSLDMHEVSAESSSAATTRSQEVQPPTLSRGGCICVHNSFTLRGRLVLAWNAAMQVFSVATTVANTSVLGKAHEGLKLAREFSNKYGSLKSKLRICFTFLQLEQLSFVIFDIPTPLHFEELSYAFSWVSFDLASGYVTECWAHSNFFFGLLVVTLAPLGLLALLGAWARSSKDETKQRLVYFMLLLTFLVLPATTTMICKTFMCEELDTTDVEGEDKSFLVADYGIECDTETHKLFQIYAGVMVGVYPIGIPLLYIVLLLGRGELGLSWFGHGELKLSVAQVFMRMREVKAIVLRLEDEAKETEDEADVSDSTGVPSDEEKGPAQESLFPEQESMESLMPYCTTENIIKSRKWMHDHEIKSLKIPKLLALPECITTRAWCRGLEDNPGWWKEKGPDIDQRPDDFKSEMAQKISYVEFLVESCKSSCFFLEVVEAIRRLTLTALPIAFTRGSQSQVACGLLATVVYLIVYALWRPYSRVSDNALTLLAQFTLFLLFLYGLLDLSGSSGFAEEDSEYATVLLALNCLIILTAALVFVLFLGEIWRDFGIVRDHLRERCVCAKGQEAAPTTSDIYLHPTQPDHAVVTQNDVTPDGVPQPGHPKDAATQNGATQDGGISGGDAPGDEDNV